MTWALANKQVRQALINVLRALFVKAIIASLALMVLYVFVETRILSYVQLWEPSHLKATVVWSITVAVVMLVDINISRDEHLFKKAALDNLKITVLLDFLVNLYVFSFIIELVFIPFTALIGGMLVIAESHEKYKRFCY